MHLPLIQAPCVHQDPNSIGRNEDEYAYLSFDAMGCRFEILILAALPGGSGLSRGDCQAIAEEMRELVLDWHRRLSIFEPQSITTRINRSPAGIMMDLDSDMYALCALCDHFRMKTRGAFHIAAGTLMQAHGFRFASGKESTLDGLELENAFILDDTRQTLTKTDERVSLDFGAIAKGFVLDLIRDELDAYGVVNAFIHGGTSSLLAIGEDHLGRPWTTRVQSGCTINLAGLALGVSENRSQTIGQGHELIGHVMDPRTNLPADNTISQIVCIHPSAAAADAYATACCVSPDQINQLASDPCSMIAVDVSQSTHICDPLGIVQPAAMDYL